MNQESTPVQTLSYYQDGQNVWPSIVRAAAAAGIGLGGLRLTAVACQFVMFYEDGSRSGGWQNEFGFILELISCAAAIMLVAAGLACWSFRPGSRKYFLLGLAITLAVTITATGWQIFETMFQYGPQMKLPMRLTYNVYLISTLFQSWVCPALVLWLVSRPPVARLFNQYRDA